MLFRGRSGKVKSDTLKDQIRNSTKLRCRPRVCLEDKGMLDGHEICCTELAEQ